ncbi:MAG: hypothetical protein M1838_005623 [Thelocarpon superellum]|nr:MAG: hypothetical protein M1838_005623 [Thelocarpon superellum]
MSAAIPRPMALAWAYAVTAAVALLGALPLVRAHEHDTADIPEGEVVSAEAIDTILWIHITTQLLAFGIVFPAGMVLGIIRSRWHVPVQVGGIILAILGYFLGHSHGGRQFAPNIHASFASSLMLMLLVQILLGVYLRLHLSRGFHTPLRKWVVIGHGVVGKVLPVASWVQMLFGGITALGFCQADHLGQCLAHFIMGSAFIGYGIVLIIMMLVGQSWLKRTGRSQEFFDSAFITAWGIVNTFTEHHWGGPWVHNDLQHTSMGIIWWCAGLVGIWLSRRRDGGPKRNLIPALVIFLTGWAMSAHPQHLPLSAKVHSMFGYTLMLAGLTRMVEVAFVLRDKSTLSEDGTSVNSFQNLPPFLLIASGFLFMGATEEQMKLISDAGVTHVSYILILYSMAFLMFLLANMLVHLYAVNAPTSKSTTANDVTSSGTSQRANGHATRGSRMAADGGTRVRDAEEFELEGLMSDDEQGDEGDEEEDGMVTKRSERVG